MAIHQAIIGLCWGAFFVAWAVAAIVFGGSGKRRSPPRAWGARILFAIAILAAVDFGTRRGLRNPFPPLRDIGIAAPAAAAAAGVALCVAGAAFAIWARVALGSNWGMPMSVHEDPQLVTFGPYRYVRHPIYTGLIAMWIGTSLVYPLGALPSAFVIGYMVFSALREEHDMERRFPEAYPAYKRRSKMLVPFLI